MGMLVFAIVLSLILGFLEWYSSIDHDKPSDLYDSDAPDDSDDSDGPEADDHKDSGPAPYDSDHCWGCPKACTYRGFKVPGCGTADAIREATERARRSETGYAGNLDAADGDLGDWTTESTEIDPIAIAKRVGAAKRAAWWDLVESCSEYCAREVSAGRDPFEVKRAVTVAADVETPF